MHDPDFVLFDVCLPVPVRKWPETYPGRWSFTVSRRTNPENLGQRVYPWWRPAGYRLTLGGQRIMLWEVATVWHQEPGGADSGTVCKGRHNTAQWAWQHRDHLRVQVIAFRKYRRWVTDRCADCGQRFGLKEARYGTWEGTKSRHYSCSQLSHVRYQLDDAYAYLINDANVESNVKWRVEREMLRRLNANGLEGNKGAVTVS